MDRTSEFEISCFRPLIVKLNRPTESFVTPAMPLSNILIRSRIVSTRFVYVSFDFYKHLLDKL